MQASTTPFSNKCHPSPTCPLPPLYKTPQTQLPQHAVPLFCIPSTPLSHYSLFLKKVFNKTKLGPFDHSAMAEHRQQEQLQQRPGGGDAKGLLQEKGPSKQQILAVVTGVPIGGFFLLLSGLTLTGTLIGLVLTAPLFVICSPVLVPAALTIALAVAGFLTSGAFGITALSSISWIINYLRRSGRVPEQLFHTHACMHGHCEMCGALSK